MTPARDAVPMAADTTETADAADACTNFDIKYHALANGQTECGGALWYLDLVTSVES